MEAEKHFLVRMMEAEDKNFSKVPGVHYKFIRYSRNTPNNIWDGPACQINRRGKTIYLKGSQDYEEILSLLVLETANDKKFELNGNIYLFEDAKEIIEETIPDNRKGQIDIEKKKRYDILTISGEWTADEAKNVYETFKDVRGYSLVKVSVEGETTPSFTVKKKPPQNKGEYDLAKVLKFCKAKLENTDENAKKVLDAIVPEVDVVDFKKITVENKYDIQKIGLPKDYEGDARVAAIRKGIIKRVFEVDGESNSTEFEFIA